jgi:hypothetical protein
VPIRHLQTRQTRPRFADGDRVEYSDLSPWELATVLDRGPFTQDQCDRYGYGHPADTDHYYLLRFDGDPQPLIVCEDGMRRPRGARAHRR